MSRQITDVDVELGKESQFVPAPRVGNALVTNPTYDYLESVEKVHGYLSKQFPTTANPAPLGLCAFALTTLVLSLYNAGGLVCKFIISRFLIFVTYFFFFNSYLGTKRSCHGFSSILWWFNPIISWNVGIQNW